jgi:hypothetical protein
VIVDEASLAGTLSLDRITAQAAEAGAKVLLVGDWAQLQSVEAGGAFAMLVHHRTDAPELSDVHRFAHEWEKTASLALRHGHAAVIDTYASHGRIHGGSTEAMIDAAYTAWRADVLAGRATVLVTDSAATVAELNNRARADLTLDGTVTGAREAELRDGARASVGDLVITRRNDRRLHAGKGFVRNGDRWTVLAVREDGSLTVRRQGRSWGNTVTLPAGYVSDALDLGYAITAHRVQGITTDTAHVLIDPATTRESLDVALTRGRDTNTAYVATDQPDDAHTGPRPDEADDPLASARRVLAGVLAHTGAELSAHETITAEAETWGSIAQLGAEYETLAQAAQHDRWATLITGSGLTPTQAEDALTSEAFGALTAELRRAEANGHDVDRLLPRLVAARGFTDADDVAAVLHYRVARATERPAGTGRTRQAPRLIAGLIPEATGTMTGDMRQALTERRELIEARADTVLDRALDDGEAWAKALGPTPADTRAAATWRRHARTVAAYRDRHGVTDPTTPLGAQPQTDAQRLDAARAKAALDRARQTAIPPAQQFGTASRAPQQRRGLSL